jgi:hypothetical protein
MGASKIRFTPSKKKGETWLYPEEPAHKMGMETFKRLRDGPQGQPKKNIAAVTLFSLAQNAARKMVRWVIDQEGKLHAGDGFFLIHMDIVQSWGAQKYKGWIDLEKKYYAVASVDDGVVRNVDPHMVTDKMVQRIVKWAEQKGLRLDREQVFESYMNDTRLYLNELFDQPIRWHQRAVGRYEFDVNEKQYYVVIRANWWDDRLNADITFGMKGDTLREKGIKKGGMDVLGTGDSIAVFSTVVDIIKNYHNYHGDKVEVYTFSALHASRQKLYDALSKKMLMALPHGQWVLNKNPHDNGGKVYTFKKILKEAYDDEGINRKRIAYNQIVDFVKNLPRKFARFVITPDDKIWISDGHKHIHYEISTGGSDHHDLEYSEVNKKFIENTKWAGVVNMRYDDEKFFAISKVNKQGNYTWGDNEKLDGKAKLLVDYLKKHGFAKQVGWDV